MAQQVLQHSGPAIVEEYYPQYASTGNRTTPLSNTWTYVGSAIILLSMGVFGLPITALAYSNSGEDISVSLIVIGSVAAAVVFAIGLAVTVYGFKSSDRDVSVRH